MLVIESELALLAQEWEFHLRAKNLGPPRSRRTSKPSACSTRSLLDIGINDLAEVDQRAIEKFVIQQSELVSPGSVLTRFRSIRVFLNWLVDSEELERSPMARMKEPKGEQKPPDVPADEDVRRLLKSLSGRSFDERRDLAILRFMFDTGTRVGDVSLRTADVDTRALVARLRQGAQVPCRSFRSEDGRRDPRLSARAAEAPIR